MRIGQTEDGKVVWAEEEVLAALATEGRIGLIQVLKGSEGYFLTARLGMDYAERRGSTLVFTFRRMPIWARITDPDARALVCLLAS